MKTHASLQQQLAHPGASNTCRVEENTSAHQKQVRTESFFVTRCFFTLPDLFFLPHPKIKIQTERPLDAQSGFLFPPPTPKTNPD